MKRKQAGVGLIEVMVTLFIMSIGLLGIASLQATGIQAGYGASLRTMAILVSEDISNRMKANQLGVYNNDLSAGYYAVTTAGTGTNNSCNDLSGADASLCAYDTLAAHDIYLWKQNIANSLPPGATGEITWVLENTTLNGNLVAFTITLSWTEKGTTRSYIDFIKIISQI